MRSITNDRTPLLGSDRSGVASVKSKTSSPQSPMQRRALIAAHVVALIALTILPVLGLFAFVAAGAIAGPLSLPVSLPIFIGICAGTLYGFKKIITEIGKLMGPSHLQKQVIVLTTKLLAAQAEIAELKERFVSKVSGNPFITARS